MARIYASVEIIAYKIEIVKNVGTTTRKKNSKEKSGVTPLEHRMHQQKNSSEFMVHQAFRCLLIKKRRFACLVEVGMLD